MVLSMVLGNFLLMYVEGFLMTWFVQRFEEKVTSEHCLQVFCSAPLTNIVCFHDKCV